MIYDVNITELKRVFFAAYFDWLYSYDTVKIYRQLKKKKKKKRQKKKTYALPYRMPLT